MPWVCPSKFGSGLIMGWDRAIEDAKKHIKRLESAVKVFGKRKNQASRGRGQKGACMKLLPKFIRQCGVPPFWRQLGMEHRDYLKLQRLCAEDERRERPRTGCSQTTGTQPGTVPVTPPVTSE